MAAAWWRHAASMGSPETQTVTDVVCRNMSLGAFQRLLAQPDALPAYTMPAKPPDHH